MRIRSPDLGPVDEEAALNRSRAGAGSRKVGAGVGFAHADAEITFAGRDARQDRLPLFLGTEAQQQRTALAVCDPVGPHRGAGGEHFFEDDITLERGALVSPVAFGPGHTNPAARPHLAAKVRIAAPPGAGPRRGRPSAKFTGEELANFAAESF